MINAMFLSSRSLLARARSRKLKTDIVVPSPIPTINRIPKAMTIIIGLMNHPGCFGRSLFGEFAVSTIGASARGWPSAGTAGAPFSVTRKFVGERWRIAIRPMFVTRSSAPEIVGRGNRDGAFFDADSQSELSGSAATLSTVISFLGLKSARQEKLMA